MNRLAEIEAEAERLLEQQAALEARAMELAAEREALGGGSTAERLRSVAAQLLEIAETLSE